MPAAPVRKWYFAINDAGFDECREQIAVAVRSALARTDLAPVCLYNGSRDDRAAEIEGLGARVIRHESSIADALRAGYGDLYPRYSGHWLRVDIPLIEEEDPFVLYTDTDVMFLAPPVIGRVPRTLAAGPERHRWRRPHFNSGVMVLNVEGMRAMHARFVADIRARMERGWRPPGHDQVSYNRTFRWRHARLPATMNWKPYWGASEDARIVHFHGPKPHHARDIAAGGRAHLDVYAALHARAPEAYEAYGRLYEGYLAG